jgi:endoribonuclease Dicer
VLASFKVTTTYYRDHNNLGGKNNKKVYKYENWIQTFRDNDVFVFIARKFYDLLMHGYIKMDQIDLLILDEAHHTNQEHLYNLVMTDFFFSGYVPGVVKRPKILALTASPIKQKIEASKIYRHEIEEFL